MITAYPSDQSPRHRPSGELIIGSLIFSVMGGLLRGPTAVSKWPCVDTVSSNALGRGGQGAEEYAGARHDLLPLVLCCGVAPQRQQRDQAPAGASNHTAAPDEKV